MSKKKKTLDDFKKEKEYIMWSKMYEMANKLNLTQNEFYSNTVGGVYWEPFFVLLYKFGNYTKMTGKLKDIKMDYIRPLTYLGDASNENVVVDGDKYIVDKTGISSASQVKYAFGNFLNTLYEFPSLDDKNFQKTYKTLHS